MILTLLSTSTASGDDSIDITSNITSTYDHYMFVCTDMNPATDTRGFRVQFNAASQTGFNETITSSVFAATHYTDDTIRFAYTGGEDQDQGTSPQILMPAVGNGADESCAGILHLFRPASTTYIKHFYSRFHGHQASDYSVTSYVGGYINVTAAIDEISFDFDSGVMDGVIQMFGIA